MQNDHTLGLCTICVNHGVIEDEKRGSSTLLVFQGITTLCWSPLVVRLLEALNASLLAQYDIKAHHSCACTSLT